MNRPAQARILTRLFVVVTLLVIGLPVSAEVGQGPATVEEALVKTRAEIAERVQQNGEVSVIVGLDMPFRAMGRPDSAAARAQQASIRSGQDALLNDLRGMNPGIKRRFEHVPAMALTVNEAALKALYRSPRVSSVELDRAMKPLMASSNPSIGTPAVWDLGYDGSGWAVAVFDSGVDLTHPWFNAVSPKIVSESCYSGASGISLCPGFVRQSTEVNSGDDCGDIYGCDHGTHVAGTVAGNDGMGPDYGVARGADLIAVQVFSRVDDSNVCGNADPCIRTYSSDLIAAMGAMLTLSASVDMAAINMSLGGGGYLSAAACDADNPSTKSAIDNLRAAGVATVISSGNDSYINSISWPGCISSAISVGATWDTPTLASFSNVDEDLDLLAPGVSIYSAIPGVSVGRKQGTSMAAPHVAGAWAVLKQAVPGASVDEVEAVLKATGTPVDDTRSIGTVTGMPRINLDLALEQFLLQNQVVLYGTVVDATDGVTPVHPVRIDLIDPITGDDPPDLGVINEPDGSYRIDVPAEGDWKVLFNAVDTANGYIDELYDGIVCEIGSCDRASLGTPVSLSLGGTELNVDLASGPLAISGTVQDEGSAPIAGVAIEVLDATGALVGDAAVTAGDGSWSKALLRPGTYYARTTGESATDYQPEIWTSILCDNCDPLTWGTPIQAIDSDINGINFQLALRPQTIFGGTVTSANDGSSLTPVTVHLLDGATGAPLGITADTNAEGRYDFAGIAPGSYKIAYDAHGAVASYQDELYDNIPCSELGCDAVAQGTVVNVLPGESELHVDLWTPTSLSGKVVDAANGVTPIHPVAIDLIDPQTSSVVQGYGVRNNPDGSYVINGVPPGDYFVFFNTQDGASTYMDEWHDGSVCDDDSCDWGLFDWSKIQAPFTITYGTNELDVDLRNFVTLSGKVTEEFTGPLEGVPVEVFDSVGNEICCGATTNGEGVWAIEVSPWQEYYVRIANVDLGGLVPEIWNNMPCEDCDPLATGKPIEVSNNNVVGIDFELAPPNTFGDCATGELISASGFENYAASVLEFTGNTSAVMQGTGDAAGFEVAYTDDQGTPLNPSKLSWCLTENRNLQLEISGTNATVTATGFELGSADLVVRDPETGAEARAPVVFAELMPDAVLLDANDVLEGVMPEPGTTGIVRLARTPQTQALAIGAVLAAKDGSTMLVRVSQITVLAEEVELLVESAAIDDFYNSIVFNTVTVAQPIDLALGEPVATVQSGSGELSGTTQGIPVAGVLELECNAGLNIPEFGPTGTWDPDIKKTFFTYRRVEGVTLEFDYRVEGTLEASIDVGKLSFQSGVNGVCSLKLTDAARLGLAGFLTMTGVGAPGAAVAMSFTPYIELSASYDVGIEAGEVNIPELKIKSDFVTGVRSRVNPLLPTPDFEVYGNSVDRLGNDRNNSFEWPSIAGTFKFQLAAAAGVQLEPVFFYPLWRFVTGPVIDTSITTPFDPLHRDYTGPKEELYFKTIGTWAPGWQEGLKQLCEKTIARYFPGTTVCNWYNFTPDADFLEFYSARTTSVKQPQPRLFAKCAPNECPVELRFAEWVDWSITDDSELTNPAWWPFDSELLQSRLVGWKGGNPDGEVLGESLTGLEGLNNWYPETVDLGDWVLKAQLQRRNLEPGDPGYGRPYAGSNEVALRIGNAWALNVLKEGQGTVISDPRKVNCGATCMAKFDHGSEVQVTAEPEPGWWFKQWDAAGPCNGSQAKTCRFTMFEDYDLTAVFEPWPVVTVEKREGDNASWTVGTLESTPAGITCGTDQFTAICSSPVENSILLKAIPSEGKAFDRWENCDEPLDDQCTVIPAADTTVVAVFSDIPKTLVVDKVDPGGSITLLGQVTSSPLGIDCGPTCEADFVNFTTVQLTASEFGGESFVRWHEESEACAGSTNPFCVVPMTKDVNQVKAVFSPGPRMLSVERVQADGSTAPGGRIVTEPAGVDCGANCTGSFEYNSWAAVSAKDEGDWYFVQWADDSPNCAGSTNRTCVVRMNLDQTAKAEYEYAEYELVIFKPTIPLEVRLFSDGYNFDGVGGEYVEFASYANGSAITLFPTNAYKLGLKLNGTLIPWVGWNGASRLPGYPDSGTVNVASIFNLWTRPDGSWVMLDAEEFFEDYSLPFVINDVVNSRAVQFTFDVTFEPKVFNTMVGTTQGIEDVLVCGEYAEAGDTVSLGDELIGPYNPARYNQLWQATVSTAQSGSYSSRWFVDANNNTGSVYQTFVCPDGKTVDVETPGRIQYSPLDCAGGGVFEVHNGMPSAESAVRYACGDPEDYVDEPE